MTREGRCRVFMVQPVLPEYRVPLFVAIAADSDFELQVHASPKFPTAPDSVPDPPDFADCSHACVGFAGERLFWQRGLKLPAGYGPGDVLIVNGAPRFLSNLPLLFRARRQGLGIVWWGHGWSSTSKEWRAAIRYRLMRLADVVLLYTEDEVRDLTAAGVRGVHLCALNNTIDLTAVRRATLQWNRDALEQFKHREQVAGRKLLLFCGRLRADPPTELDVALRALAHLTKSDPDYLLCVIGDGNDGPRLRDLVRALGLERHVRWVGAIYEEAELAPWFLNASCFVYPGPIGLSLIHAFGYGLPVITHGDRRRQGPEIGALRSGENGLTFARGDAPDLCAKIDEICNRPGRRQALSHQAMATIENEFSFDGMVDRFKGAIRAAARISMGSERAGE